MITIEQLQKVYTTTPESILKNYIDPINNTIEKYKISNPAMFIAQLGHESGNLMHVVENLNYRAQRLLEVFPKYFNNSNVHNYAHKPQAIANRVYANRMGNGDEKSGDGWTYRGKGAIQLTGKNNHAAYAKAIDKTLEETVAYLLTPEGAIDSAGWFWDLRNINEISNDVNEVTRRINGGYHGLRERKLLYAKARAVI